MSAGRRIKRDSLRLPREGTQLRRLYDALADGAPVNVAAFIGRARGSTYLNQLRNFYNCEIVPGSANGKCHPRLVGRWDGLYFVPVERLHAGAE